MDHFSLAAQVSTVSNTFWYDSNWRRIPRSAQQTEHLKANHKAQTDRAIGRYALALGGRGWLTTAKVEELMGMYATECNSFLRKLRKMGFIDSRPRGGGEKYIRNRGWEWKWKEESMEKALKDWIDGATYEQMLFKWKTDPKDSPIYNPQYAACIYFSKQMKAKMQNLTPSQVESITRLVNERIGLTPNDRGGTIQAGH